MEQTQLKNRIARRELGGCYLFCGEEDYLKRRFRDDIRAAVLGDGAFAAFDHAVFDGSDVSVADVLDAAKAAPFSGERRLVEWNHLPYESLRADEKEALARLCAAVADECPQTVLLLICGAADFVPGTDKRPGEGVRRLSERCEIVRFDKSEEGPLLGWMARHFAHGGVRAGADVCRALLSRCGRSMEHLDAEIDKLVCYVRFAGRDTASVEDVDRVCSAYEENDAFALTNALLAGDVAGAFRAMDELRRRRVEPTLVLGQLSRFFCDLCAVSALLAEGKSREDLAAALRMHSYKAGLYVRGARRMGDAACRRALDECRATDLYVKSVYADAYEQIEKLLVRVTTPAS